MDHDKVCKSNFEEENILKDGEKSIGKFACYCDKTFASIYFLKGNQSVLKYISNIVDCERDASNLLKYISNIVDCLTFRNSKMRKFC